MRLGKFALIRPVMTFTDGRCVARIRWMPMARAFCASMRERLFDLALHGHHQVGELVDDHTMYGRTPPLYGSEECGLARGVCVALRLAQRRAVCHRDLLKSSTLRALFAVSSS